MVLRTFDHMSDADESWWINVYKCSQLTTWTLTLTEATSTFDRLKNDRKYFRFTQRTWTRDKSETKNNKNKQNNWMKIFNMHKGAASVDIKSTIQTPNSTSRWFLNWTLDSFRCVTLPPIGLLVNRCTVHYLSNIRTLTVILLLLTLILVWLYDLWFVRKCEEFEGRNWGIFTPCFAPTDFLKIVVLTTY